MKITRSGFMFGGPFQIRYLDNFSNSLIFLEKSFKLTFTMAYLAFLNFFYLALVLRARAVNNPFPDLPNFPFDSEDVVSILSRWSNFSEIFKISYIFKMTRSSLSLISLCFLILRVILICMRFGKSQRSLTIWTKWIPHLQSQKLKLRDQESGS